jgi:hypothetical protein
VLAIVIAFLALGSGLGFAIHRQTEWGQHVYTALRHARATATSEVGKDRQQLALVAAAATTQSGGDRRYLTHVAGTATSVSGAYHRLRREATATSSNDLATATAQQGIIDQMPPSPTPTPNTPYLQTCLQEDIDQQQASCTREVDAFYVNGASDDAIAFVVPDTSGYNFSSLEWRLFKFGSNGGSTPEGSYTDSSGDPQNPGVWWELSGLLNHFPNYQYGVDTGTYKMEVLDHDGQVMASTTFTIKDSPFANSSGDTPTPDTSNQSFDLPTDTPGPTF